MNNKVVYANRAQFEGQSWVGTIARNYWIFIIYFLFKALEWRFNRELQTEIHLDETHQPVEPPKNQHQVPISPGVCPLCRKPVNIPAIVKTANHVYCYTCLINHIDLTGKCPQTGLAVESREVTRIFD